MSYKSYKQQYVPWSINSLPEERVKLIKNKTVKTLNESNDCEKEYETSKH